MGADYPPGTAAAINYGFDRIRFPGPVKVDSRVRARIKLVDATPREQGRYLVRTENTIEVENQDRPALVAEWLFVLIFPD
jgi:acyl dehydratase